MKKNFKIIALFLFTVSLAGCEYLDYDESSYLSKEDIFVDFDRTKNFLTNIYNYLPDDFVSIDGAMRAAATDEAVHVWDLSNVHKMNNGTWSAIQPLDNVWGNMYSGIRAANVFLEETQGQTFEELRYNLDYAEMMEQFEMYPYEARFLRAFYYFELAKRYKNIPLITEVLTPEESLEIQPSDFSAVIQFIVDECDEIAEYLPVDFADFSSAQETGRATKGAAMALKARALLYAASPLHNPENDLSRWQAAAVAAKDIIDLGEYSLESNYSANFNNNQSAELIFGKRQGPTNGLERRNFPVGFEGGNTGTCPTQNLIDAYDMKLTGLPITIDPFYDPEDPYTGRDPRLYQTVILNLDSWKGQTVETFFGGTNGLPIANATKTGYYLRKYLIEDVSLDPTNTTTREHTWVLFRYGEVLLNYAEAINEAYGPTDDGGLGMTARDAVAMIRQRSDMPMYLQGLTKEAFRERLQNERRVELAFEDHRFWDVRRWMIGETTTDIYAMDIRRQADDSFTYEKVLIEERFFEDYMNLYPIPQSEIYINSDLTQNPGW